MGQNTKLPGDANIFTCLCRLTYKQKVMARGEQFDAIYVISWEFNKYSLAFFNNCFSFHSYVIPIDSATSCKSLYHSLL